MLLTGVVVQPAAGQGVVEVEVVNSLLLRRPETGFQQSWVAAQPS